MLANMQSGELGVNIHQVAGALLSTLSELWLISHSGPVVYAISSWVYPAMPIMATILSVTILLWTGSCTTQLLFHTAREKMIAQNPPAIGSHVIYS